MSLQLISLSRQRLIMSRNKAITSPMLDAHEFRLSMSEISGLRRDYDRYYRRNAIKK